MAVAPVPTTTAATEPSVSSSGVVVEKPIKASATTSTKVVKENTCNDSCSSQDTSDDESSRAALSRTKRTRSKGERFSSHSTNRNKNKVESKGKSKNGNNSDHVAIEDRPLPSPRELSKVLCRIIDDEAYTEEESKVALKTLSFWASKQDVPFGNGFADVGGLQQVLFFIEDNMEDCQRIAPALETMETLCKPLHGTLSSTQAVASAYLYESKALSNMRTKIGKCIVDLGGVDMMILIFKRHALERQHQQQTKQEANSNKSSSSLSSLAVWSVWNSVMPSDSNSTSNTHEKDEYDVDDEPVVSNACMVCAETILGCGSPPNLSEAELGLETTIQRINTARHSMEVLVLLIPHVIGVDKNAPGKILEALCEAVPVLLVDNVARSYNNKENNENSSINLQAEYEALIASLLTCLVATSAIASTESLAGSNLQRAKELVSVTNSTMRMFPSHHGINRDGCLVLAKVCRHLPRSERKRLGVVASLGSVVASASIDQDVKDIADEILEEQFK